MTAVEHFMGNAQPQLFDVAELIPVRTLFDFCIFHGAMKSI
jgi:hypothetical protein